MSASDTPPGQDYKGPSGISRDSTWLNNEDLPHDRDVEVTIEKVLIRPKVTFGGGRSKDNVISLKLVGKKRELGITAACNRNTLNKLFGSACGGWWGKKILLYVDPDAQAIGGGTGPAVRIRARRVEEDGGDE